MHKVKFPRIFQPFRCDDLIRLGKSNDGGYLVNKNDVLKTNRIISLGIGEDWSFEEDFLNVNDCELVAFDESVRTNNDAYSKFFDGKRKHLSQNITKDNFNEIFTINNIFLKCDIEGYEYNLFESIISNSDKFTGIVLELHNINDQIPNVFNFISKLSLRLVHVHVNNYFYYKTEHGNVPDILEMTFTSSKNIRYDTDLKLPHTLDMSNNPKDFEFEITF